jgi:two-component system nitrogen regulation response regulator NtrX
MNEAQRPALEPPLRVLVVEDMDNERGVLLARLNRLGYDTVGVESAERALEEASATPPDLAILDLNLGTGMRGDELLPRLKQKVPGVEVLMLTATGTKEDIFEAGRQGAYAYLEKPPGPAFWQMLENAGRHVRMRRQSRALELGVGPEAIVGQSAALRHVLDEARKAAPTSLTVLLTGENGTGKDLVARFVHARSRRADRPFVKLNCAAIPRELVESELFGHERGAFTGAAQTKKGKFELAEGGSLFLDEIGDLSPEAQAKVLHAVERGEIERVGATRAQAVNVRLVAATNKELAEEVRAGRFREDLYFRLNVVPIHVPALRDRAEDVALLADHFLARVAAEEGLPHKELTPAALDLLRSYSWPGNVRELRNLMERAAVLVDAPQVAASDLEPWLEREGEGEASAGAEGEGGAADGGLKEELERREAEAIRRELEATRWNVTQAAARLGLDRTNLHRKMRKYRIRRHDEEAT